jgi:hypothetical protein
MAHSPIRAACCSSASLHVVAVAGTKVRELVLFIVAALFIGITHEIGVHTSDGNKYTLLL